MRSWIEFHCTSRCFLYFDHVLHYVCVLCLIKLECGCFYPALHPSDLRQQALLLFHFQKVAHHAARYLHRSPQIKPKVKHEPVKADSNPHYLGAEVPPRYLKAVYLYLCLAQSRRRSQAHMEPAGRRGAPLILSYLSFRRCLESSFCLMGTHVHLIRVHMWS